MSAGPSYRKDQLAVNSFSRVSWPLKKTSYRLQGPTNSARHSIQHVLERVGDLFQTPLQNSLTTRQIQTGITPTARHFNRIAQFAFFTLLLSLTPWWSRSDGDFALWKLPANCCTSRRLRSRSGCKFAPMPTDRLEFIVGLRFLGGPLRNREAV